MTKLCIDCKHHVITVGIHMCGLRRSVVDGETYRQCSIERDDGFGPIVDCKSQGLLWEPKQILETQVVDFDEGYGTFVRNRTFFERFVLWLKK